MLRACGISQRRIILQREVSQGAVVLVQVCLKQLSNLTRLVRGQLSKLHRKLVSALITIDVHARDIVKDLAEKCISSEYEFDWQMQLRYVWDAGIGDMFIHQVNTQFQYAYEYLGAQARLVVTPMTDRCGPGLLRALNSHGAATGGSQHLTIPL